MKKYSLFYYPILITLFILIVIKPVFAADIYQLGFVDDGEISIILTSDFDNIVKKYDEYSDNYDNLLLLKNNKIIKMEIGIINFNKNDKCNTIIEYQDINGNDGYTNPCYGLDAAYIETKEDYSKVVIYFSNVWAKVNLEEIELIPYELVDNYSYYSVENKILSHSILTDNVANSKIVYDLGLVQKFSDGIYYSYDGHFLYDDFRLMLIDYSKYSNNNAVNSDKFYNYYQYLSHRSLTTYNREELVNYFNNLGLNSRMTTFTSNFDPSISDIINESQLYGELDTFLFVQNYYGANALEMIALAENESAIGKSSLAFRKNNLFGHAAYDSSVEKSSERYLSVTNSIFSHGKNYISKLYANPNKFQYHGAYFGDKGSGMNVSYASDPYWGEKAASYFFKLDQELGFKDLNQYSIGFCDKCVLYDENLTEILRINFNDYAMIILEDLGTTYKIQYDKTYNEDYSYKFNEYAYINKEDVKKIINKDSLTNKIEYEEVTLDAKEGLFFNGENKITFFKKKGYETPIIKPFLKLYDFVSFQANSAIYKKIASIELMNGYNKVYQLNDYIDLDNTYLQIRYTDNSKVIKQLTSDYVTTTKLVNLKSNTIEINYQGYKIDFQVEVDYNRDLTDNFLTSNLSLTGKDLFEQLNNYDLNNLDISSIREIDKRLFIEDRNRYIISDGLEVSGLSLNFFDPNQYFFNQKEIELNKEIFSVKDGIKHLENNGYQVIDAYKLTLKVDEKDKELIRPIIISNNIDEKLSMNGTFYLFKFENNDIIRCKVEKGNGKISFKLDQVGNLVLAYKNDFNHKISESELDTLSANYYSYSFIEEYRYYMLLLFALFVTIITLVILRGRK